jgi:hypothetical protein
MVTFPVVMLVGTVIFTAYVAKGATRVRKLEKPEAVVLDAPRKIKTRNARKEYRKQGSDLHILK